MNYLDEQYYHVFNRGSRSEKIFFSNANYEYFIHLLGKNTAPHLVYLAAYCLMPNHYHLVLQQNERGSISKFIQSVMTSYVQAVNKKYGTSGTLFQGKAKAKIIDSDESLFQVTRYVHLNPVKAGLVKKPVDWLFSDYREWIKDTSPTASSDRRGTLRNSYFANGKEYRQFVEEYQSDLQYNKFEIFIFNGD